MNKNNNRERPLEGNQWFTRLLITIRALCDVISIIFWHNNCCIVKHRGSVLSNGVSSVKSAKCEEEKKLVHTNLSSSEEKETTPSQKRRALSSPFFPPLEKKYKTFFLVFSPQHTFPIDGETYSEKSRQLFSHFPEIFSFLNQGEKKK